MPHEEKADFAFAFRDVIKTGAVWRRFVFARDAQR